MAETILIPIFTYGAESWDLLKKEAEQVQTIFNKAIKTIMFLPNATPTSILLAETGFGPIEQNNRRESCKQEEYQRNQNPAS